MVIVDDGSVDRTAEAVRSVRDPRVRYFAQSNCGAAAARNRGVELAAGRYITFLDSDDRVRPGWLTAMFDGLTSREADLVCFGVRIVSPGDGGVVRLPRNMGPAFNNLPGPLLAGAYALRRTVFERVGGFDASCSTGQHTDLALRLAELGERHALNVHAVMAAYVEFVQHGDERLSQNPRKRLDGTLYLIAKHEARLGRDPRALADYWGVAGVSARKLGRERAASSYFLKSAKLAPFRIKPWIRYVMSVSGVVPSWVWRSASAPAR